MWEQILGAICVLCRQTIFGPDARRQLCRHCLADLPWLAEPERPPPGPAIARQISLFHYQDAARDWILAAKRERGLVAARVLGTLMAESLLDAYPRGEACPQYLVPVPLSVRRLLHRGHNQATLIGTPVARILGIPLACGAVRRRRHTRLQPGLDAGERARNVAGAFVCRRQWQGATVAIMDDLVTTGATASSLADALLAAGAGAVHLWSPAIAHTPD